MKRKNPSAKRGRKHGKIASLDELKDLCNKNYPGLKILKECAELMVQEGLAEKEGNTIKIGGTSCIPPSHLENDPDSEHTEEQGWKLEDRGLRRVKVKKICYRGCEEDYIKRRHDTSNLVEIEEGDWLGNALGSCLRDKDGREWRYKTVYDYRDDFLSVEEAELWMEWAEKWRKEAEDKWTLLVRKNNERKLSRKEPTVKNEKLERWAKAELDDACDAHHHAKVLKEAIVRQDWKVACVCWYEIGKHWTYYKDWIDSPRLAEKRKLLQSQSEGGTVRSEASKGMHPQRYDAYLQKRDNNPNLSKTRVMELVARDLNISPSTIKRAIKHCEKK